MAEIPGMVDSLLSCGEHGCGKGGFSSGTATFFDKGTPFKVTK